MGKVISILVVLLSRLSLFRATTKDARARWLKRGKGAKGVLLPRLFLQAFLLNKTGQAARGVPS